MFVSRSFRAACFAAIAAAAAFFAAPASAQGGLFGALFGDEIRPRYDSQSWVRQPLAAPSRDLAPRSLTITPRRHRLVARAKIHHHAHRPAVVAVAPVRRPDSLPRGVSAYAPATAPVTASGPCCRTAAEAIARVAHDPTLRRGDVYVTPDGPRVFVGSEGDVHRAGDFVPLAKAGKLTAERRALLVRPVRADRLAAIKPVGALAAIAAAAPVERMIVDSRGRTIRFVGGYEPAKDRRM